MSEDVKDARGLNRRRAMQCLMWGSAGVLWTISGGVPKALRLDGEAVAAEAEGFSFAQISDTHIGFKAPVNPDPNGTLTDALTRITAARPAFLVHTGDVSHLAKPEQFDTAAQIMKSAKLDTFYIPGEHDTIDDDGKLFFERFGRAQNTGGWYSFDMHGVHFVALVNVVGLKGGGQGRLGAAQREWLEDDLKSRSASTPIIVLAHMPLWSIYPQWGWGTEDSAPALDYLKRFGSVTVLNGHIHQVIQKVEGNVTYHTALSTAFPQPAPGDGPGPGPLKVPADKLKSMLGVRSIDVVAERVTLRDAPLQA
ncbi:MAG TPA: metallophosphoesterase [Stellaceae bacterium]|jgi:3',5'-cyclic AMP phosphodiesterase CpdA|nr:metallophosphoesterase [Stellaceae bacterium]